MPPSTVNPMSPDASEHSTSTIHIRQPESTDGLALHELVAQCPPLDPNSIYCNLLHCSHFAQTGAAAWSEQNLVGFVSGYRVPERPHTLFVWQVAVSTAARGQGLGKRLIRDILDRQGNQDITHLETTITPDNEASWALFRGLARDLGAAVSDSVLFDQKAHFHDRHGSEVLLSIGPFSH